MFHMHTPKYQQALRQFRVSRALCGCMKPMFCMSGRHIECLAITAEVNE